MSVKPSDLVAAGPWRVGSPSKTGNYLVEISAHNPEEQGFEVCQYLPKEGWDCGSHKVVLRYAPIHKVTK